MPMGRHRGGWTGRHPMLALVTLRRPPVSYDANVIWWFHATWFSLGGDATAKAMADPLFSYSHPEYPPLAPTSVAWVWWLSPAETLRLGQDATAVQTLSALTMLAYGFGRVLAASFSAGRRRLHASSWWRASASRRATRQRRSQTAPSMSSGRQHSPRASFFSPRRRSTDAAGLAALCLATAALTKNEGFVAVLVVTILCGIRFRRRWHANVGVLMAPVIAAAWFVVTRIVGAHSLAADDSRFSELLTLDGDVTRRIIPTLAALWDQAWPLLVPAVLVTLAGMGFPQIREDPSPRLVVLVDLAGMVGSRGNRRLGVRHQPARAGRPHRWVGQPDVNLRQPLASLRNWTVDRGGCGHVAISPDASRAGQGTGGLTGSLTGGTVRTCLQSIARVPFGLAPDTEDRLTDR